MNAETFPLPPMHQNGHLNNDDTYLIFWSSGTTGQPKGIQESIGNFRQFFTS